MSVPRSPVAVSSSASPRRVVLGRARQAAVLLALVGACDGTSGSRTLPADASVSYDGDVDHAIGANADAGTDAPCEAGATSSRTRFAAAQVEPGSLCEPELQHRTCQHGAWSDWSGSYRAESCEVRLARDCEGGRDGERQARERWAEAEVQRSGACVSEMQTRTCRDGAWTEWSGTLTFDSCRVLPASTCEGVPDGTVETRERFRSPEVPFGASCAVEQQQRTCRDGVFSDWSGSFAYAVCAVHEPASCDGVAHGESQERTAYGQASVPFGETCSSEKQTRTCYDGAWSAWTGSYQLASCETRPPERCGASEHGATETRIAYAAPRVPFGQPCVQEEQTRTCSNGQWGPYSGTFAFEQCTVDAPQDCGSTPHGAQIERDAYAEAEVEAGGTCRKERQTNTCSNGTWTGWTGSYTFSQCQVLDACGNGRVGWNEVCDPRAPDAVGCSSDCRRTRCPDVASARFACPIALEPGFWITPAVAMVDERPLVLSEKLGGPTQLRYTSLDAATGWSTPRTVYELADASGISLASDATGATLLMSDRDGTSWASWMADEGFGRRNELDVLWWEPHATRDGGTPLLAGSTLHGLNRTSVPGAKLLERDGTWVDTGRTLAAYAGDVAGDVALVAGLGSARLDIWERKQGQAFASVATHTVERASAPEASLHASGNGMIVWQQGVRVNELSVWALVRSPSGSFGGEPFRLSDASVHATGPRVVADALGAWVLWKQAGAVVGRRYFSRAVGQQLGFQPQQTLCFDAVGEVDSFDVAGDGAGGLLVVCDVHPKDTTPPRVYAASVSLTGDTFHELLFEGESVAFPKVAMNEKQRAVVAWWAERALWVTTTKP